MLSTLAHAPVPLTFPSPARDTMATTQLPIIPPRPVSQRPKLSINTEQPRIPGKAASLRLDLLSAVSPTVRNTFSNAYQPPVTTNSTTTTTTTTTIAALQAPSPAPTPAPALERPSKPRLCIDSTFPASSSLSTPTSASTLSSALTSASSNHSATLAVPYKQPHNLVSILANSARIPRKMAPSRPMFPAQKRVSFRTPLEEDITTVKYTLAHSDLQSSSSTLSSIASVASTTMGDSGVSTPQHSVSSDSNATITKRARLPLQLPSDESRTMEPSAENPPRPSAPRIGEKRDSSSSDNDSDSCPETPVAGRRKRRRDWRWTLGSLTAKGASPTTDAMASEDSS